MSDDLTDNDQSPAEENRSKLRGLWDRYKAVPIVIAVMAAVTLGITQSVTSGVEGAVKKVSNKVSPPPVINAIVQDYDGACSSYVVPQQPLPELGRSPELTDEAFEAWGQSHGHKLSPQRIMVTITGYGERPVTLTRMRLRTTERGSALKDGYMVQNQCGDETVARYAEIDFDQNPPRIIDSSADTVSVGSDMATEPLRFPYTVSGTDTESLLLIANTENAISWYAEIAWTNGIDKGIIRVDQDGNPFDMMAGDDSNALLIPDGEGGWVDLSS